MAWRTKAPFQLVCIVPHLVRS